jgi:hypothetical protein
VAGEQVLGDNRGVGARTVDIRGAASALETLTEHVQTGNWADAVAVGKLAVGDGTGDMQPSKEAFASYQPVTTSIATGTPLVSTS